MPFNTQLQLIFGNNPVWRIALAPVKDLQRCVAKFADYKPPCAAYICDYLRASILCSSFHEMVDGLRMLCKNFQVTRIKSRIGQAMPGNKAILVNLVVEDQSVKPHSYEWSGWWKNQKVRMVAEVIRSLISTHSCTCNFSFYLSNCELTLSVIF